MPDTQGLSQAAANRRLNEATDQAEIERKKRAQTAARLFNINDWHGAELFSLGQLYALAEQFAEAEQAFVLYLADQTAAESGKARRALLAALLQQQKYRDAVPVAALLLQEPAYDEALVSSALALLGKLAAQGEAQALTLAEKMLPGLIRWAETSVEKQGIWGSRMAEVFLSRFLQLNLVYRQRGELAQSEALLVSFRQHFDASRLKAHAQIAGRLDAEFASARLIGVAAPTVRGIAYLDMPATATAELQGQVLLLDFTAHWCSPCIAKFPELNRLQEKYRAQGFTVIGVTSYYGSFDAQENLSQAQELAALRQFKTGHGLKFGLLVSPPKEALPAGEASMLFQVTALPTVVLIDRSGKVRLIERGAGDKEELERMIQRLLAEATPNNSGQPK